jgi:hypothetical protein
MQVLPRLKLPNCYLGLNPLFRSRIWGAKGGFHRTSTPGENLQKAYFLFSERLSGIFIHYHRLVNVHLVNLPHPVLNVIVNIHDIRWTDRHRRRCVNVRLGGKQSVAVIPEVSRPGEG